MCGTCGCSDEGRATVVDLETGTHTHIGADGEAVTHSHDHSHTGGHTHEHGHAHDHHHEHGEDHVGGHQHGAHHHHQHGRHHDHGHRHTQDRSHRPETVSLEAAVLAKNDGLAAQNRAWFAGREILAVNLVSSPGSGKTSLLERTIREQGDRRRVYVIEGDQQTANDAERIRATGAPSVQINTGTGCHLEADMVMHGLRSLRPDVGSIVMIENVGNLVCPALFDLGEAAKVAILSVTEGEDKPMKYPHMFRASKVMLLNKIDLLPYVDFDSDRCIDYARQVNPDIEVIQVSVKTGEGLDQWYAWLERESRQVSHMAFA